MSGTGYGGGGFSAAKSGSWNSSNELNGLKKSDSISSNLLPISKDNYTPVASVQARDQAEVDRWMIENDVSLDGEDVPCPVFEFEESTFPGFSCLIFLIHHLLLHFCKIVFMILVPGEIKIPLFVLLRVHCFIPLLGMIVNLLLTNFHKPTPIQSISWPVALSGHDLVIFFSSSFLCVVVDFNR